METLYLQLVPWHCKRTASTRDLNKGQAQHPMSDAWSVVFHLLLPPKLLHWEHVLRMEVLRAGVSLWEES